jgi:hypothetical protein
MPGALGNDVLEVWQKGTIYSCRAHNATSFVPAVLVSGREILEEIWRFWEIEPADSGSTSVRLVVGSSCILVRISFLGRGCTDDRTGDFVSVGPPVRGRSKDSHAHSVHGCNWESHMGVLEGEK